MKELVAFSKGSGGWHLSALGRTCPFHPLPADGAATPCSTSPSTRVFRSVGGDQLRRLATCRATSRRTLPSSARIRMLGDRLKNVHILRHDLRRLQSTNRRRHRHRRAGARGGGAARDRLCRPDRARDHHRRDAARRRSRRGSRGEFTRSSRHVRLGSRRRCGEPVGTAIRRNLFAMRTNFYLAHKPGLRET